MPKGNEEMRTESFYVTRIMCVKVFSTLSVNDKRITLMTKTFLLHLQNKCKYGYCFMSKDFLGLMGNFCFK